MKGVRSRVRVIVPRTLILNVAYLQKERLVNIIFLGEANKKKDKCKVLSVTQRASSVTSKAVIFCKQRCEPAVNNQKQNKQPLSSPMYLKINKLHSMAWSSEFYLKRKTGTLSSTIINLSFKYLEHLVASVHTAYQYNLTRTCEHWTWSVQKNIVIIYIFI